MSEKENGLLKYVLSSDEKPKLVIGQLVKTGFGKEIEYLENMVKQGRYEWDMINGVIKYWKLKYLNMIHYNKLCQSLKKVSAAWHAGHIEWSFAWDYLRVLRGWYCD